MSTSEPRPNFSSHSPRNNYYQPNNNINNSAVYSTTIHSSVFQTANHQHHEQIEENLREDDESVDGDEESKDESGKVETKRATAGEIRIPEFRSSAAKNSLNNPKLSYTPFQLELLNMIYLKWKHPKAEQKTFIAKCVGITRKQTMVISCFFLK